RMTGLASAAIRASPAARRSGSPRIRSTRPRAASTSTSTAVAATYCQGSRGSKATDSSILLAQPFEEHRHMHLVGFVIAGQHVHHDVYSGPIGEHALERVRRHGRKDRPSSRIDCLCAGEIGGGDQDRTYS